MDTRGLALIFFAIMLVLSPAIIHTQNSGVKVSYVGVSCAQKSSNSFLSNLGCGKAR